MYHACPENTSQCLVSVLCTHYCIYTALKNSNDHMLLNVVRVIACRCIQTLTNRVAGLQSVLASTRQRSASDRYALEELRREHAELQVHLRSFIVSYSECNSLLRTCALKDGLMSCSVCFFCALGKMLSEL